MGGWSLMLAKGRVCWSLLQPWGALHDDTKNGCVADYARAWSRKEKIIPLATHWLNNWWQICRAYGYFLCDSRELKQRTATRTAKKQSVWLAKQQLCKCITLFLYISLPSLPDYNVKVPEFTFCRGREHKTTTFFSFPELWYSPLEFNSKNICQHLTK